VVHDDGRVEETEPPVTVPPDEVIVLQPYGALFFASAATLVEQMPTVTPESTNSVVILRVRGADEAGATLIDVLSTYAGQLRDVGSKLVFVTDNDRVIRQLRVTGALDVIGPDNVYRSSAFIGEATRRAYGDARSWVAANRTALGHDDA
jgi:SulP family sulfate permease